VRFPNWEVRLPDWVDGFLAEAGSCFPTAEDRMGLVIGLSRRNVDEATGGPFGAAVFEAATGRLVAPGVNVVMTTPCSVAHAETMAIAIAQRIVGHYDLGGPGMPDCEIAASTEPCAMCLGAINWSGVRSLVCGARDEDATAIGFDEGPKRTDWADVLTARGLAVTRDVLRAEAAAVLQRYADTGGAIYNARQGA